MKLLLFGSLLLSFSIASYSQYADTSVTRMVTDYLRKSSKQKTAGWILLGGGAAITTIGLAIGSNNLADEILTGGHSSGFDAAAILIPIGLISMAGSIPLFVAAGKNRRKAAASVSLKLETATTISQSGASTTRYPSVALRFRL